MPSKTSRAGHYLAIAEFYGRQVLEDLPNRSIPEFVVAEVARRAFHFARMAEKLDLERRRYRNTRPAQAALRQQDRQAVGAAISPASPS